MAETCTLTVLRFRTLDQYVSIYRYDHGSKSRRTYDLVTSSFAVTQTRQQMAQILRRMRQNTETIFLTKETYLS